MSAFIQIHPNNHDTICVKIDHIVSIQKQHLGNDRYRVIVQTTAPQSVIIARENTDCAEADLVLEDLLDKAENSEQYYGIHMEDMPACGFGCDCSDNEECAPGSLSIGPC